MSISIRLSEFLEARNIRQKELADIFGITRQAVGHFVKGRAKLSLDYFILLIEKYPELNANWLLTGNGKMLNNNKQYDEKLGLASANDIKITNYSCTDCISKQNEIDALKRALDSTEELLEIYRAKKTNCM